MWWIRKISLILVFIFSVSLMYGKWGYYLFDLTRITRGNFTTIENKLNSDTSNKYSILKYYKFNGSTLETSTRMIIQSDTSIDDYDLMKTLVADGVVQKIMEVEYVDNKGIRTTKRTKLFDYLTSETSWYYIVGVSTP